MEQIPQIDPSAKVFPGAVVIGEVKMCIRDRKRPVENGPGFGCICY